MQTKSIADQLINHVGYVIDASGSMHRLTNAVNKSVQEQTDFLANTSEKMDQETRITAYTFDDVYQCHYYDMDAFRLQRVLREKGGIHYARGSTALVGASLKAIDDLERTATLYGDHAFLVFVWTDGGENASSNQERELFKKKMANLPSNWTLGVLVPDQSCKQQAIRYGFPENNIAIWTATEKGLQAAQAVVQQATQQYFEARSQGVRGTTNLFKLDLEAVTPQVITEQLIEIPEKTYTTVPVDAVYQIAPFVRDRFGTYKKGMAFYQHVESEHIRPKRQVILRDKQTNKLYTGPAARQIVGLDNKRVTVRPQDHPKWDIFFESTSYTRKLDPGTELLVMKQ